MTQQTTMSEQGTTDQGAAAPELPATRVQVDWETITGISQTTLTTHLWTAPPLRRGSPIHDKAFGALRELNADLVRFLPWFSHPRLGVPALTPPTDTETSWNFELLDPIVEDFMNATAGRPVVANFATIPTWMFDTPQAVEIPADPDEIQWDYEQGTEFRDPTLAEVADYFYRVASWYIAGGFTDELGRWHESGHHYRFAYWEVLCEPDLGHRLSPEVYTRLYDAVVERLQPLDPDMKFIGLSLSHMHHQPEYFWQFLDPAKHRDGIPLDAFSYHFYASPEIVNPFGEVGNAPSAHWRNIFYAQADAFLDQVRLIESIRRRLAPNTKTFINELGTYPADVMNPAPDIPDEYWALSASLQSYLWANLVSLGIDLVGIAEFMDYPGMIPGTSLLDWESGAPNARYHALALLLRSFAPGDSLVATSTGVPGFPNPRIHAQGFVSVDGSRSILLINKTTNPVSVAIDSDISTEQSKPGRVRQVSTATGDAEVTTGPLNAENGSVVLTLDAYGTAVLTL
ncbi:hypothetical protein [Actinopolymorpha alba]|uniref:hypothetical protein n=1 Tax=Actinopolymorpha alba TaxID=533267 RepID=UPI0003A80D0B|nr:hypothetical protein [Actinopolymorpha alba]